MEEQKRQKSKNEGYFCPGVFMKKSSVPALKKRNHILANASAGLIPASDQPNVKDLCGCVCELFPDAWPRKLREWQEEATKKKSLEPELFLFIALICGSHFRTESPDMQLQDVRDYLYDWLAGYENRMNPDVAQLVVAALTPGISKEIVKRGHKRGLPHVEYSKKRGRPLEDRGAWVVALIIARHLTQKGIKLVRAKDQAVKLLTVLLGKKEDTALRELNRYHKEAPKDIISKLTKELIHEYDFWVKQDGVHQRDIPPPHDQTRELARWKSKHKELPYLLRNWGREGLSGVVLSRIKPDLWKPLWDMKTGNIEKDARSE